MKTARLYTLLALLLMAGRVTMQAQIINDIEEVFVSYKYVVGMAYISEDEIICFSSTIIPNEPSLFYIDKIRENGELLSSVKIWTEEEMADMTVYEAELIQDKSGVTSLYYVSRIMESDSVTFHKININDDLELDFFDYNWYGLDYPAVIHGRKSTNVIVNKDGGAILSYNTSQDSIRVVRFGADGEELFDNTIGRHPQEYYQHNLIPSLDSLGCRIVTRSLDPNSFYYDCYCFGPDLNVIDTITKVDVLSYPILCANSYSDIRVNPFSGRAYLISHCSMPAFGGNPEIYNDIVMSVYDENMVQLNYDWGFHTNTTDMAGEKHTIDFGSEDDVFMVGSIDAMIWGDLYIVYLDANLNKKGELYFVHPERKQTPLYLVACPKGGCVVSTDGGNEVTGEAERCIYKVTISDFLNVDEAHSHGFSVATAYPNPGKDVLNIRTGLRYAWVEVYDVNGRLVHRQDITENVTGIDAGGWASGTYIWKVYTGVSAGSTTHAETGKWIKELDIY
jgi:hypothetical protein